MHLKLNKTPKQWPVPRKGRKFVVVPSHNIASGIPLLFILRDMLHAVHTRREAKLVLREGKVLVNGKKVKEEKLSVGLFDLISLEQHHYRLVLQEKGKFSLDQGKQRIAKIVGKNLLSGKRTQIHLHNGNNFIVQGEYRVGDSVILDQGKIKKVLPLQEKAPLLVIRGKLAGLKGMLEKIEKKFATVSSGKEKHIVSLNNIMVVEHD